MQPAGAPGSNHHLPAPHAHGAPFAAAIRPSLPDTAGPRIGAGGLMGRGAWAGPPVVSRDLQGGLQGAMGPVVGGAAIGGVAQGRQGLVPPMPGPIGLRPPAMESTRPNNDGRAFQPSVASTALSAAGHPRSRRKVSRQFWQAGDLFDLDAGIQPTSMPGLDHARLHPRFLHSNATSHKWALGALAELLDNSMDEVDQGCSYVRVDKVDHPTEGAGNPMIIIEDNGGGMDPSKIRNCMSFGFSMKQGKKKIGQYGNGFKTSTMRLGADALVITRCKSTSTCSVGLLSYTFLTQTNAQDVVVPIIDYDLVTRRRRMDDKAEWDTRLSLLCEWGPYKTEADIWRAILSLADQGTRVCIWNLWQTSDDTPELDFVSHPHDMRLPGWEDEMKEVITRNGQVDKGAARCHAYRHSLRAYVGILYLEWPQNFKFIIRGVDVEKTTVRCGMKHIMNYEYRPRQQTSDEGQLVVPVYIGFAKEAPDTSVSGFCVYHRNRLIKPFWKVYSSASSMGRGVIGYLQVDFVEPAHDKQDFENTPSLQKLEKYLKKQVPHFWKGKSHLIGYRHEPTSYARRWRTASVLGSAQNAAPNTAAAFVGAQGAARRSTTTSPSSTPSMPGQQQANSGHNDASQHLENRRMHHHLSQGRAVSGSAPGKARRGMNSTPADTHLSVRQGMAAGGPADGASDGWNRVAGSKARMQNQHLVDPQLEAADDGPAGTEAMGLDDLRTCGVGGVKSAAVQSSAAPARLLQDMQDEVESLQQRMQDFCNKHRIDERIQCDLGQLFGTSLCAVLDSARGLHDLHEEQSMVLQRIVAFVSSLPSHGLAEDNFPDFVKGLIARNQGQPATSDHASPAASAKPAPGKGQSDASPSTPIQGDVSISGTVRHHVEATVKKEPPALCSQAEGNEEHMDGAQGTSASQMPPDLTPKTGSRPSQKLPGPSAQTEPQMDASLGASSRAQLMQGVASNLGRGDSASVPRSQPQPRDVASGPGQPAVNGNSPAALDSATRLPAATTMAQNLQRSGLAASAGTVPGPQAPRLGIMSPQPGMAAPKLAEAAAQGVSAAGVQKAGTVVRAPADGMRTKAPMGKETEPERQQMGTSTQATAARTESSVLVEAATRRDQISLPSQSNGSMAQQPQASQSRGGLAPMATQPIGASSQMLPASQQTVGQLQSVMTSQPAGLPEVMVAGRKAPSARAAASGAGGTVPQQTVDDSRQVIRSPNSISSGVPQNHLTGHSHKPIATASVPQRDCGSQAEPKGAMPPLAVRQLQPRLPGQEPVNVPLAAMPATAGTSSLPPHPGASSVPQAPQQAPSDPASTARVPSLPPPNHVVASSVGPMQFVPTLQQQNLGAGNVVQPPSTIARSSPQPTARQPAPVAAVPGKKGAGGAGRPRKAADTEANLQQIGRNLIAQFLKTSLPVSSDQGPTQRAASASVPGTIPASSLAQPIANAAPGHPAKELQPSAGPSSGDGPSAQTSAAAVAAPVSSAKPQPAANQQSTDVPNVHTEDGGASTVLKNVPQSQPFHGTSEVRTVQPGGDDVMQAADALATGMEQAHASSGQKRTRAESFDDGSSLQAGHSGVGAQQPSADRGSLEESPHPGPKRQKGADAPEPAGSNAVKGGGQDSVVSEAAPRAATSTGELGPPSTELGQSSETIASGPEPGNSGSVDGRYAVTVGLVVENQRGTAGGCMLSQNGEAGVGERGPGTNDGQVCIRGNGRNSSHLETLVASNESGD